MKLNLGAGNTPIEGYTNLDGGTGDTIFPLGYTDVDEIRASHVLEHFGRVESLSVLKDWVSCLKPGGVLKIAVPDINRIFELAPRSEVIANNIELYLMGGQVDERDYHKSIWFYEKLKAFMEHVGLSDIEEWESEIQDCACYPFSLNLKGVKHGESSRYM